MHMQPAMNGEYDAAPSRYRGDEQAHVHRCHERKRDERLTDGEHRIAQRRQIEQGLVDMQLTIHEDGEYRDAGEHDDEWRKDLMRDLVQAIEEAGQADKAQRNAWDVDMGFSAHIQIVDSRPARNDENKGNHRGDEEERAKAGAGDDET